MSSLKLRFGPAGMPLALKGKKLSEGISYTSDIGLSAFEIEFVQGVRLNKDEALKAKEIAEKKDVLLSCHAPYFVNCCSPLKEKQDTSKRNLLQALHALQLLNGKIAVFHAGFYQKQTPKIAGENAIKVLEEMNDKIKSENFKACLGIETTGKPSQYGSLDEVLDLCKSLGRHFKPAIDFAHIHARENGKIKSIEDYENIINKIKEYLGREALEGLHCHFSELVYGEKGEKYHIPLGNKSPDFKPLAELIKEKKYKFTIICESPLLEKDALKMLDMVKNC